MKTQSERITIPSFIERLGITMHAETAAKNPNMDSATPMDHWYCTLRTADGSVMGVHFSTGMGLRKEREGLSPLVTFEQWQNRPSAAGPLKHTVNRHKLRADYDSYVLGRKSPVAPDLSEVLNCLASDASSTDCSFEDWCAELGYDTDSRKGYSTYQACLGIANQLKGFLGPDNYETLLWNTERL